MKIINCDYSDSIPRCLRRGGLLKAIEQELSDVNDKISKTSRNTDESITLLVQSIDLQAQQKKILLDELTKIKTAKGESTKDLDKLNSMDVAQLKRLYTAETKIPL